MGLFWRMGIGKDTGGRVMLVGISVGEGVEYG